MILYISNATDYSIYNELFSTGQIYPGYQVQKFNNNIINGLSRFDSVAALSALHYKNQHSRIEETHDNIRYICIANKTGVLHKIGNVIGLHKEGTKIIKDHRPKYILCDAIASSPCYVSKFLAKKFHIPVIGIITDLPGMLGDNKKLERGIKHLQNFDGYVLLTEQMNAVVNPHQKPYMVMEGLCSPNIDYKKIQKHIPRIVMYTGSLWKKDAGIEYFIEGFIQANIENCELHFYGTGELVDWIKQISGEHPQVKYMGCVSNEEIVRKQKEATLLVNPRPSNEEFCRFSFPSKTIEYMSSGTPVLMTRLPGVPKEYFDYVYIIDTETVKGVGETLKAIFALDQEELEKKGKIAFDFVATHKNCVAQTKRINDFCSRQISI